MRKDYFESALPYPQCLPDYVLRKRRVTVNCDEPILTDQSQTPMTEINNIMDIYTRTKMLPGIDPSQMIYTDDTQTPQFEASYEKISFAREQFAKLPQALRNELNHDLSKFETWLTDPNNAHRAEQYGLIKLNKKEIKTEPSSDSKAVSPGPNQVKPDSGAQK